MDEEYAQQELRLDCCEVERTWVKTPFINAVECELIVADTSHMIGSRVATEATTPKRKRSPKGSEALVQLAGRPFRIRREFLADVAEQHLREKIGGLNRAVLILHSPYDAAVGIGNATGIFVNARHPKSFVSLVDADHLLTRRSDAVYAANMIAAWCERFLA